VLKRSTVSFPTAITAEVDEDEETPLVEEEVVVGVGVEEFAGVFVGKRGGRNKVVQIIAPLSPAKPYFLGLSCVVDETAPIF
jgi:hypothetical protein